MLARAPIIILLAIAIIFSACTTQQSKKAVNESKLIVEKCIELCKKALAEGKNLSNGPCLSTGNQEWQFSNWVCDVAHSPRKAVDNLKENQCPEYGTTASNFVEVDEQCNLIRVYKGK